MKYQAKKESLLQMVYNEPHNLEARLVYSDFLQDIGDKRGEFIALQIEEAKTQDEDRKEILRDYLHKNFLKKDLLSFIKDDFQNFHLFNNRKAYFTKTYAKKHIKYFGYINGFLEKLWLSHNDKEFNTSLFKELHVYKGLSLLRSLSISSELLNTIYIKELFGNHTFYLGGMYNLANVIELKLLFSECDINAIVDSVLLQQVAYLTLFVPFKPFISSFSKKSLLRLSNLTELQHLCLCIDRDLVPVPLLEACNFLLSQKHTKLIDITLAHVHKWSCQDSMIYLKGLGCKYFTYALVDDKTILLESIHNKPKEKRYKFRTFTIS